LSLRSFSRARGAFAVLTGAMGGIPRVMAVQKKHGWIDRNALPALLLARTRQQAAVRAGFATLKEEGGGGARVKDAGPGA
jgi:hypothetical protein